MCDILRRRGLPDRLREKSLFPSKPSLTASRYISQDDDAISEHSRVTGRWRDARDTERYWSAVKRDVNCRGRRKTPEAEFLRGSRPAPASLYRRNRRVNGRINKYSRNCSKRMGKEYPPRLILRVLGTVIMPHYYSIKRQRRRFRS